jgi:hypothetical protein
VKDLGVDGVDVKLLTNALGFVEAILKRDRGRVGEGAGYQ